MIVKDVADSPQKNSIITAEKDKASRQEYVQHPLLKRITTSDVKICKGDAPHANNVIKNSLSRIIEDATVVLSFDPQLTLYPIWVKKSAWQQGLSCAYLPALLGTNDNVSAY